MQFLVLSLRLSLGPSSKALRFLTALQAMGYVSQNKTTHLYQLTFKLCRIANQISVRNELYTITHPHLLLLNYTPEQLDRFIAVRGLERRTANTITTRETLIAELDRIRAEGVAYDDEECEAGVRCIACPIRDYTGAIVAGISATGPAGRMNKEKLAQMKPTLMQAARELSYELLEIRESSEPASMANFYGGNVLKIPYSYAILWQNQTKKEFWQCRGVSSTK